MSNLSHSFDDIANKHEHITRKHWLKRFFYKSLIQHFLTEIQPKKGDMIVELACGNGYYGQLCLNQGAKVYFLDINAQMLGMIKNRLKQSANNFLIQGDIRYLPIASDKFQKTVCFGAFPPLPTLEDVEKAIQEFVRITKPGGKVYFTYNPPHPLRYLSVKYWRLHARIFSSSMRDLPFIDGRTSGTHTHEEIRKIVTKFGKNYRMDSKGLGIFGAVTIDV